MPELPEVETVRRAMEAALPGRIIQQVDTSNKRLREKIDRRRLQALRGDRFVAARRRAKYLLLDLESGTTLLIHLGMSGNLLLREPGVKHDHVVFHLDSERPLVFNDPRRFGMVIVLEEGEADENRYLSGLGPEPLTASFNTRYLQAACSNRKTPIKTLIMDGHIVVGVGNIYASEALFQAGIHPQTPAGNLNESALADLVHAIKRILRNAVRKGGTTISDYLGSGEGGRFQQRLAVYGRAGEPCRTCQHPLQSLIMSGRNTFYCAHCQQ
ncbi:MAG: bifunctional DNA-formamidopyrimidine glycosylase/DNA-(apurinic or apyrimidinic site) lyase [Candidatus Latescibacterota bacterium]